MVLTVDEWPGGVPRVHEVKVTTERFGQLFRGRASIPFARVAKLEEIASLPWGSAVKVNAPGELTSSLPARRSPRAGSGPSPILSTPAATVQEALAIGEELRSEEGYGPRAGKGISPR